MINGYVCFVSPPIERWRLLLHLLNLELTNDLFQNSIAEAEVTLHNFQTQELPNPSSKPKLPNPSSRPRTFMQAGLGFCYHGKSPRLSALEATGRWESRIIANLPNHSQENDVFLDHSPPAKLMANCIVKNKFRKLIKMAFPWVQP